MHGHAIKADTLHLGHTPSNKEGEEVGEHRNDDKPKVRGSDGDVTDLGAQNVLRFVGYKTASVGCGLAKSHR